VGAILGSGNGVVEFLGYGIYDGEHVPTEAVGFIADTLKETKTKNPRILLDSGSYVYGCECWWGSETKVKKMLKGQKVTKIEINDIREKLRRHI
jgi:hypothetical protein